MRVLVLDKLNSTPATLDLERHLLYLSLLRDISPSLPSSKAYSHTIHVRPQIPLRITLFGSINNVLWVNSTNVSGISNQRSIRNPVFVAISNGAIIETRLWQCFSYWTRWPHRGLVIFSLYHYVCISSCPLSLSLSLDCFCDGVLQLFQQQPPLKSESQTWQELQDVYKSTYKKNWKSLGYRQFRIFQILSWSESQPIYCRQGLFCSKVTWRTGDLSKYFFSSWWESFFLGNPPVDGSQ